MYAEWDDAALVTALQSGDEGAFTEIYERYWSKVFWVIYRKIKVREASEELVQDLFISLWNKRIVNQIDNLERYLMGAVKYRVIDHIRAHLTEENYSHTYRSVLVSTTQSTEEDIAANDLTLALHDSIEKLPEKTREVFRLSRIEQRSVKEIAAMLQISEKAVEYHLTKSLKLMKDHLKDFVALLLFYLN
ncbi:RNA polymerase sigma-70 factor [Xanthocytophaga agilis]|uniref:RNA polymerase sigma-70 factor n=1 Tax=Xanthocytophaga agilis TaxID=3048010 RepID=A0AAE3RBB1_9BACT|nr:RNA polymerase sigma-70 factor [Xanthocytophaga agilis]MDJ1504248.1 RNA polymerase sigma-70 factor [Xanthocytophaga agilis]